ncbi:MAG: zinc-dependent metalloprotease family protein [Cyanobacteria bacterium J06643_4]
MNHLYSLARLQFFRQQSFRSLFFAGAAIALSTALSSCTGGGGSGNSTISFDEARELNIQPIQVCNDAGAGCAEVNLFADITRKILDQAKLKVNFLPTNRLNASRFLKIDASSGRAEDHEFYQLSRSGGAGAFGRHPSSTRTSGPINVWFVDEIESSNGVTQFGLAWVDANGVLISQDTANFNNGRGRADTLAHEVGHNLGLRHTTLGAGSSNNLLTDGSVRNIPGSIDDIFPNGVGTSQLTTAQIKEIRSSSLLSDIADDVNTGAATGIGDNLADLPLDHSHSHLDHSHSHSDHSHSHPDHSHSHLDHSHSHLAHLHSYSETAADSSEIPEPATWVGLSVLGVSILTLGRKR